MIRIDKSKCRCGKCNEYFDVEWDVDYIDSNERNMGEECEYRGENEFECPKCNNIIHGELIVYEYPVGCLNYKKIESVYDSFETGMSEFEEPFIVFYDL